MAVTFPADMIIRGYASVLRIVDELQISSSNGAPRGLTNQFVARLYQWRQMALDGLPGGGRYYVAAMLLILGAISPRLSLAAFFAIMILAGYPALRFSERHAFHMEIVALFALGFLLHGACGSCIGAWKHRATCSRAAVISASRGLNNEIASKVQLRLGERVAGLAALEKTEYLLNGTLENYPLFKNLEGNPLIRSAMICPICYDKKVLGILNISRTLSHVPFTQEDLTRASLLARQIGAAIHLSQICRTLEDRAREFKTVFAMYQQGRQELEQIEKLSSVMVPMPKDHRLSA